MFIVKEIALFGTVEYMCRALSVAKFLCTSLVYIRYIFPGYLNRLKVSALILKNCVTLYIQSNNLVFLD